MKEFDFEWVIKLERNKLQLMVDMWKEIVAEDNNNGFLSERKIDDYYFRQLANDVNAGHKLLLIIKNRNQYLGQMVVNLYHQDTYKHRADVCSLMLLKSARSAKTSLLVADCLIEICENLKLKMITIDVRAGSSQEKLWKFLGFEVYGRMPHYSRVGDENYEGVFLFQKVETMRKLLKKRLENMYLMKKEKIV
ncbi:MAG: hypothetical protein ACJA2S_000944 [Cyclobacteriaceae bacterium]